MGISVPASAQDAPELPNIYTSADGTFSFHYPDGWTRVAIEAEVGAAVLWNGTAEDNPFRENPPADFVVVRILPPTYVGAELADLNTLQADPQALLRAFTGDDDATFRFETLESSVNDRAATIISFRDDLTEGQAILVDLADEGVGIVHAFSDLGRYGQHQATVEAMAASMQVHTYEDGDVRPIVVNDLDVAFEIPAEYYALPEQEAMVFGSSQAIINDEAPQSGEAYAAIFAPELLGIDTEDAETLDALFDTVVSIFFGVDDEELILSPVESTVFDDSMINERLQATYTRGEFEGMLLLIEFVDGETVFLYFEVNAGELVDFEDVIDAIVESIQRTDMDIVDVDAG
jgi:hypothetical protein